MYENHVLCRIYLFVKRWNLCMGFFTFLSLFCLIYVLFCDLSGFLYQPNISSGQFLLTFVSQWQFYLKLSYEIYITEFVEYWSLHTIDTLFLHFRLLNCLIYLICKADISYRVSSIFCWLLARLNNKEREVEREEEITTYDFWLEKLQCHLW